MIMPYIQRAGSPLGNGGSRDCDYTGFPGLTCRCEATPAFEAVTPFFEDLNQVTDEEDFERQGALMLPISRRENDGTLQPLGRIREAAIASSAVQTRAERRFPGMIVHAAGHGSTPGVWSVLARRAWRADALTKVAALAPQASRQALLLRLRGRLLMAPMESTRSVNPRSRA